MQEKRIGTERDSATCMIHLAITLVNITDNMFSLSFQFTLGFDRCILISVSRYSTIFSTFNGRNTFGSPVVSILCENYFVRTIIAAAN